MHRHILLCAVGLVYYMLATYALVSFDIDSLASAIVLFGIPAYFLARYSAAPAAVIATVVAFGTGIALLLEGIAHIYGIWYFVGVEELRLFGIIPLEVIVISVTQILFLTLLYELIFDDGEYSESHFRVRFTAFGVFALSVLLLLALHQYVIKAIFFSHSYVWILGVLVASAISALAVQKSLTVSFLDKLALFTCVAAVPLFSSLIVTVLNTHKIFAYTHDYFFTFTFFDFVVPIEEFLLMLVLPLFIVTFYELYLDDGR